MNRELQLRDAVREVEATRAELRRSLNGPDRDDRGSEPRDESFPRSTVMRTLLKPELRWLWTGGLAALAILAARRIPIARVHPWLLAYAAVRRALDRSLRP